ncbi:hypothetical protein [Flavobacterium sp.]|uniref:hypothetical protein n=1 Tax=Flavobacterium sp. TaxID=239 RepID=UPI002EDA7015
MKQFFSLLSLILCLTSNAQKFEDNYLGKDYLLYKGASFKLKDDASVYGFSHAFYSDLKYCQSSYDKNVIYPSKEFYFNTAKDSLLNRVFIVQNIVDKNGNTLDNSLYEKPIFVLKDSLSKQIIFYKYNVKSEHDFCFNTSKITYDESVFCAKLEREVDDFTDEIKISSPLMISGSLSPIMIYKYLKKGKPPLYYLSLKTSGSTLTVNGKGVIVLFDDGTKWLKPQNKVDIDATSNGYMYSSFIPLSTTDLATFTTKKIKKIRLYIYDGSVVPSDADKFTLFVKCLKTAN